MATNSPTPTPDGPQPPRGLGWKRPALAVGAVAAIAILGQEAASGLTTFVAWVGDFGAWAPVVFITGYALCTAALVPGSILTIAGGALFGLGAGTAYAFTAALLGATLSFLIARYAARDWVALRLRADARFGAIDRAVEGAGLRITILLRLSPLFPFSFLNYALGLTSVRLRDFVLGSLAMLPGTLLYVYYGALAGQLAASAAGEETAGTAELALQAIGLIATLGVTVAITRLARRALREATGEEGTADEEEAE